MQLAFLDVFVPGSDASVGGCGAGSHALSSSTGAGACRECKKMLEAKVDKLQWQQRKKP